MNFTYRIKWSKTGISYYGVRYKDGIDESSLMTTYFTSSKYVKQYIKENGLPDIVQIRKRFDTKLDAKMWEERVIDRGRLYTSQKWLNAGNNGSFKGIIMDSLMIQKIKDGRAKGDKTPKTWYTDGTCSRAFKDTDLIPEGFVKGRHRSEKMKKYFENMAEHVRNRPQEVKDAAAKKISEKTKGKKKPEDFGEKIRKARTGISRPELIGENNPSKKQEARDKIVKSWETREPGKWFTNKETKETKWVYLKDIDSLDLNLWVNKKPSKGAWYTDGQSKMWKRHGEDVTGLTKIGSRTKI